ncbi:MAG: hypothetical protein V1744_06755 [Candidatus Altiarchaeota archaeon]
MGLSTIYANVILVVLALTVSSAVWFAYSNYLVHVTPEVKAQGDYLKERVDTSIKLTSVSDDPTLTYLVLNDGKTMLDVNCTDFYVDREWLSRSDIDSITFSDYTFDPYLWNPGESITVVFDYSPAAGTHEGRVVTCNGVSDSMIFTTT